MNTFISVLIFYLSLYWRIILQ